MVSQKHPSQRNHARNPQKVTRRVGKACDWCRIKKDRCDGTRPACTTCQAAARPCTYNVQTKKRGLPEGYVRGLERLWGLAIHYIPELEDALLDIVSCSGTTSSSQKTLSAMWTSDSQGSSCFRTWRESDLYTALHKQLTSESSSFFDNVAEKTPTISDHQGDCCSSIEAAASVARSIKRQFQDVHGDDEITGQCLIRDANRKETQSSTQLTPPDSHTEPSPGGTDEKVANCPEHYETANAVNEYMISINKWLPMIDQAEIMRLLHQIKQGCMLGSGEQALLTAIAAYCTTSRNMTSVSSEKERSLPQQPLASIDLRKEAMSHLPQEASETWDTGHIQAMVILSLNDISHGRWEAAWDNLGRAIRRAVYLGWTASDHTPETVANAYGSSRRRHTLLVCFVLETLLSTRLDLTPHLRSDDLFNIPPLDCSGIDEWGPWTQSLGGSTYEGPSFSASTFNHLVDLSKLHQSVRSMRNDSNLGPGIRQQLERAICQRKKALADDVQNKFGYLAPASGLPIHYLYLMFMAEVVTADLYIISLAKPDATSPDAPVELSQEVDSLVDRMTTLLQVQAQSLDVKSVMPMHHVLMNMALSSMTALHQCGQTSRASLIQFIKALSGVAEALESLPGFHNLQETLLEVSESLCGSEDELSLQSSRPSPTPLTTPTIFRPGLLRSGAPAKKQDLSKPEYCSPTLSLAAAADLSKPFRTKAVHKEAGPPIGNCTYTFDPFSASSMGGSDEMCPLQVSMILPFDGTGTGTVLNDVVDVETNAWSRNWNHGVMDIDVPTKDLLRP